MEHNTEELLLWAHPVLVDETTVIFNVPRGTAYITAQQLVIHASSFVYYVLLIAFAASFLLDLTALYGAYFLGLGRYAEMTYQNVLYHPLSRGFGLVLAYKGLGPLGIPAGWAIGASAALPLSTYLMRGRLPKANGFPARTLLVFSLPLFASALVNLLQT